MTPYAPEPHRCDVPRAHRKHDYLDDQGHATECPGHAVDFDAVPMCLWLHPGIHRVGGIRRCRRRSCVGYSDAPCAHEFIKDGWQRRATWLPRRNWRCALCGFETRRYDAVDRMALRPVHPHMSVAVPGFNTLVTPPAVTDGGAS